MTQGHPNPPYGARFKRDPEEPPTDSLAEAVVLRHLLFNPSLIATVDVAPLLNFPEHRAMWRALTRVYMRSADQHPMDFFFAWRQDLHEHECARVTPHEIWTIDCHAYLMWWSLVEAQNAESNWVGEQYERTRLDDPRRYVHYHDWDWWLQRLKACASARQVINAAQEMAARAWQVPDAEFGTLEARALLDRMAPRPPQKLADRVLHV